MTTPLDVERGRELAERATQCRWTTEKPQRISEGPAKGFPDREVIAGTPGRQGIYTDPSHKGGTAPYADSQFIAYHDPEYMLALYERLEAAERLVDRYASEPCAQKYDADYMAWRKLRGEG